MAWPNTKKLPFPNDAHPILLLVGQPSKQTLVQQLVLTIQSLVLSKEPKGGKFKQELPDLGVASKEDGSDRNLVMQADD